MTPGFHALQARAYERRIAQRVLECLECSRPARRRWLRGEIARLRSRQQWHAVRVAVRCAPEVEAYAAEHRFYARRGANHPSREEREASLNRAREALERGGALLAKENARKVQRAREINCVELTV